LRGAKFANVFSRGVYTYVPVANTVYTTGENEDTRANIDLFMFTDEWVFRVLALAVSLFAAPVWAAEDDKVKVERTDSSAILGRRVESGVSYATVIYFTERRVFE
jgi:hypothetical protein